eukprot:2801445-Pleurochrysis_carterae.AAC.1
MPASPSSSRFAPTSNPFHHQPVAGPFAGNLDLFLLPLLLLLLLLLLRLDFQLKLALRSLRLLQPFLSSNMPYSHMPRLGCRFQRQSFYPSGFLSLLVSWPSTLAFHTYAMGFPSRPSSSKQFLCAAPDWLFPQTRFLMPYFHAGGMRKPIL